MENKSYSLYCVRDRKSGLYATPFTAINHECAKRDFRLYGKSSPNNIAIFPDLELYYIGDYNAQTGELSGVAPEFLEGGVELE